jgi:hypothetical protein
MEQRKSYKDEKGKAQAGETLVRPNTDILYDVGLSHSSKEAPVMGVERRAEVIQLELPLTTLDKRGRAKGASTKSIPITKQMVWEAYKKVRSNKGAAGIDEETITMYEERLSDNLYILWNTMSSGSYFPPPVLEVAINKEGGKKRKLGIPTVNDRVAQQVLKSYLRAKVRSRVFTPILRLSSIKECPSGSSTSSQECTRIPMGNRHGHIQFLRQDVARLAYEGNRKACRRKMGKDVHQAMA